MILLDVTITDGWLFIIGIVSLIIIINLYTATKETGKLKQKVSESEILMKQKDAELKVSYQQWALEELEKFKQTEISKVQKTAENQYREAALVLLQRWKIEEEAKIRQDAINRSYSVNLGKITEHLVPFHASFLSQFNPKDARFIGSPIDLIVFDGYADKKDDLVIYFVEVKTGNSRLTGIQLKVRDAVLNGQIRWAEINPDNSPIVEIGKNQIEGKNTDQLPIKF